MSEEIEDNPYASQSEELPSDAYFSNEQYSEEFSDADFNEVEAPSSQSDPDGDDFGIGVDPNEFINVEDQLLDEVKDNAYGIGDAVEDYVGAQGVENAIENALCHVAVEETGLDAVPFAEETCKELMQDEEDAAAKELYESRVECAQLETEVFDASNENDRDAAIEEFQDNDCNYKIEHVDHDTLYNECIYEPSIEEARECVDEATGIESYQYGDSDNDDVPNALDADIQNVDLQYAGDSSGLMESGDTAYDSYYEVADTESYSTEAVEQSPQLDEPYCEADKNWESQPTVADYGDGDGDGIPTAIDSSEAETNIEYLGESESSLESGDLLHADSYGIEGNESFSSDPNSDASSSDESYYEDSTDDSEPSMYELGRLYTAESDAYMAQHTDDPTLAAEYAAHAEQTLSEVSVDLVSSELENYVHEATDAAEEIDYSHEHGDVVSGEQTENAYGIDIASPTDLGGADDFSDSSFGSDDDYGSVDSFDSFDAGDFGGGDTFDGGDAFDGGSCDSGGACDGGASDGGGDSF